MASHSYSTRRKRLIVDADKSKATNPPSYVPSEGLGSAGRETKSDTLCVVVNAEYKGWVEESGVRNDTLVANAESIPPPSDSVLEEKHQQMMVAWIQSQVLSGCLGLSYAEKVELLAQQRLLTAASNAAPHQAPQPPAVWAQPAYVAPPPPKPAPSKTRFKDSSVKLTSCSTKKPKKAFSAGWCPHNVICS